MSDVEAKAATEGSSKEIKKQLEDRWDPNRDIFTVDKAPPGMEMCWLNKKPESLEQMKMARGWEVVNSTNAKDVKTVGKQQDGSHQIGDAILAMRPIEIGDRERERILRERRARDKGPKERYEREAAEELAKAGIRKKLTFDES
jgi:hypothetical protein